MPATRASRTRSGQTGVLRHRIPAATLGSTHLAGTKIALGWYGDSTLYDSMVPVAKVKDLERKTKRRTSDAGDDSVFVPILAELASHGVYDDPVVALVLPNPLVVDAHVESPGGEEDGGGDYETRRGAELRPNVVVVSRSRPRC